MLANHIVSPPLLYVNIPVQGNKIFQETTIASHY